MTASLLSLALLGATVIPHIDGSCPDVEHRYAQLNALGDRYFTAPSSDAAAADNLWSSFQSGFFDTPIPDPLCGPAATALQARAVALWYVGAYGRGELRHGLTNLQYAVQAMRTYVTLRPVTSTALHQRSSGVTMSELVDLVSRYSRQVHVYPREIGLDQLRSAVE